MRKNIYLDIDMDFFVSPIEKASVDNVRLYHDKACSTQPAAPAAHRLRELRISWEQKDISCFTNHKTSYTHWWMMKKQDQLLIHIDAHSDLYRNSSKDLRLLHNGSIGCHNYIWYAIRDGYVAEVYWVIPDRLKELQSVEKAEAIVHKDLIVDKHADAQGLHIRVECIVLSGETKIIPLHVCTMSQLPVFDAACSKVTIATSPEFIPASADALIFELFESFGASETAARNVYKQHRDMLDKSPEELEEAWERLK